jgi:hypothetical protein
MDLEKEDWCSYLSTSLRDRSPNKDNVHKIILNKYSISQLKTFVLKNKKAYRYPVTLAEKFKHTSWTPLQVEVLESAQKHLDSSIGCEPYRSIISGLAGSGKSKVFIYKIKNLYESKGHLICVCAPFGFAASAIEGCILHNLPGIRYHKTASFEK